MKKKSSKYLKYVQDKLKYSGYEVITGNETKEIFTCGIMDSTKRYFTMIFHINPKDINESFIQNVDIQILKCIKQIKKMQEQSNEKEIKQA